MSRDDSDDEPGHRGRHMRPMLHDRTHLNSIPDLVQQANRIKETTRGQWNHGEHKMPVEVFHSRSKRLDEKEVARTYTT